MTYVKMALWAFVVIYVVDISGFTDSWRAALSRFLRIQRLRALPPFDCGKCAVFWTCMIYAGCSGELSVWTFAFSCLLSFLTYPAGQLLIVGRDVLLRLINKLI